MNRIYSHTQALCSVCRAKVNARIIEDDGNIFLEKICPEHGLSRALLSTDVEWYEQSLQYVKPGQEPLKKNVAKFTGCPDSCGFCPEHQQHTCLPVIEINTCCDMNCPVCLKNFKEEFSLTLEEFDGIVDNLIATEGRVDVINISGGEPTLHSLFKEFIHSALNKGITQISVSTNGKTLLKDQGLRAFFKDSGIIAALQFDGFHDRAYHFLRGEDLAQEKQEIIKILEKENVLYSLVVTVAKSINDQEIKDIADSFFKSKALTLMFQPVAFTGNAENLDEKKHRLTTADVVKELEKSSYIEKGDFNPLPCSHFSCFALSYFFKLDDGDVYSLKKFMGREDFLKIIANKTLPGLNSEGYDILKNRIYNLWSAADYSSVSDKVLERIKKTLRLMSSGELSEKEKINMGIENMKAVFIHNFMDVHTMDFARLQKCCNPYPRKGNRLIPMCAENVFNCNHQS